MIKVYPATFLFLILIILGTLFVLSSSNWLGIWLGFEMNILGFIPMVLSSSPQRRERAVKYLLVQASGSGVFLLGGLLNWFTMISTSMSVLRVNLLVLIRVLLKMGIFPFYFWVPSVINGISWMGCLVLLTWQKVAPLRILSHLNMTSSHTYIIIVLGRVRVIVGGFLGMNQTLLRSLIAYSSVAHGGWLVVLCCLSLSSIKVYFILYVVILWGLLWGFEEMAQLKLRQRKRLEWGGSLSSVGVKIGLLSLGGIPPLTGFFSKVWAVQTIVSHQWTWILVVLIIGALINLSYYLTVFFNLLISYSPLSHLTRKRSFLTTFLMMSNLLGIIVIMVVLLWR